MNLSRNWLFAAILIVASGFVGAAGNAAEPVFSEEQKQEMHKIIRDYLVTNPDVLREAFEALEQQQQTAQKEESRGRIKENAEVLFRSERGYVYGNADGNVTMVEFFDYNCGYCKRSLEDVMTLVDTDDNLKLVLKEFPILGPGSLYAARAAIASKMQGKYWEFHLALMQSQGAVDETIVLKIAQEVGLDVDKLKADMEDPEVSATINESMELANAIGINGTPAFIIADTLIPGALGVEGLRAQITEVREGGGCAVC